MRLITPHQKEPDKLQIITLSSDSFDKAEEARKRRRVWGGLRSDRGCFVDGDEPACSINDE
jgi:hypothetical protein